MGMADDFKVSTKGKRKWYEVEYESLSQSAGEKTIRDDGQHIRRILDVENDNVKLLLRHASRNKEKLIEQYIDHRTPVPVTTGIILPEADPQGTPTPACTQSIQLLFFPNAWSIQLPRLPIIL